MRSRQQSEAVSSPSPTIPRPRTGGSGSRRADTPAQPGGTNRRGYLADVRGLRTVALSLLLAHELIPDSAAAAAVGAAVFVVTMAWPAGAGLVRRRAPRASVHRAVHGVDSTPTRGRRGRGRGHAARTGGSRLSGAIAWAGALTLPAAASVPMALPMSAALGLLAAIAVMFGNQGRRDNLLGHALASPPVQYAGRLAIPAIGWMAVLMGVPTVIGHAPNVALRSALVTAALALATLTKRVYESRFGGGRLRHSYVIVSSATLALLGLLLAPADLGARGGDATELVTVFSTMTGCSLTGGPTCGAHSKTLQAAAVPTVRSASAVPAAALPGGPGCWSVQPTFAPTTCVFGDRKSNISVALAGDTRAGEWLPALEVLAATKHWRITAFLADGCSLSHLDLGVAPSPGEAGCQSWVHSTMHSISGGKYDLVLVANSTTDADPGGPAGQAHGAPSVLHELRKAGKAVIEVPTSGGLPKLG